MAISDACRLRLPVLPVVLGFKYEPGGPCTCNRPRPTRTVLSHRHRHTRPPTYRTLQQNRAMCDTDRPINQSIGRLYCKLRHPSNRITWNTEVRLSKHISMHCCYSLLVIKQSIFGRESRYTSLRSITHLCFRLLPPSHDAFTLIRLTIGEASASHAIGRQCSGAFLNVNITYRAEKNTPRTDCGDYHYGRRCSDTGCL